jgi:hypothetical protein
MSLNKTFRMKWLFLSVAVLLCAACVRTGESYRPQDTLAYVPVYASLSDLHDITLEDVRVTANPGKIYVYQQYIFQNELNEGIHIIDNTDPQNPVKRGFLSIPYNTDMAIRSSYIYANSVNDLVVIDMSNPGAPAVVGRTKGAFPLMSQDHPPANGYFVCPDPSKGIVVDWKLETVRTAACRR